ncbi:zona pellucida sperm-binding protein 4-like [Oncorhynchus tshawytscha]|uniref:Zona pellucida sperm-binding protein 4 n=1 Tax=Oncorhynchus tshawytscha TaxID=74940 RepID=A0A8C8JJ19_ONCTS|nr:zona pellucida sperm-binding protein 4-like [Oncorhynchus tshawytscha]
MASSSARCVVVLLAVFVHCSSANTWRMLLQKHQAPVVQQAQKVRQQPPTRPVTYDQQAKKLKNLPQWPPQWVTQGPDATTPIEKCQVKAEERLTCGVPDLTLAQCEAINCCFDEWRCYYGKAVTVQCTRDGQFVVVVARDATLPNLDLDTISLLGPQDALCKPVGTTKAFAIYQFPVTACGTTLMEESGYVVYENKMISSYEVELGPRGSITRDSHFELQFQCKYSDTAVEFLVVEVNALPPPAPVTATGLVRVELRLASGQCYNKGCVEEVEAYRSYYSEADYPVAKLLKDPVYAEVHILGRTDSNLVLNLDYCWATSTPSPLSLPKWDLLVDGCPYQDDRYLTNVIPVDGSSGLEFLTHYKRFTVKMFTFVDADTLAPLKDRVFIHCSTEVCHPTRTHSCQQSCNRQRRDVAAVNSVAGETVVSSGELILT